MGKAKFAWNDRDTNPHSLTCQLKVQDREPDYYQNISEDWSLDGTVREVTVVGIPLHEVYCVIEAETDYNALAELRRDALYGIVITYTPDTDVPATTASVQFVEMTRPRVENRGRQNLFTSAIRMRRTDGSTIP